VTINPKATILIPTYKRSHLLNHVLKALTNQTYQNFEVLVVLKPSGDGTEELLENYKRLLNIKVIKQTNGNVIDAINLGIKQVSGEITVFFDDDAVPLPDCIQAHVDAYSLPNLGGTAGDVITALIEKNKVVPVNSNPSELTNYKINPLTTNIGRKLWNSPINNMDDFFIYISKAGVVEYLFKDESSANHQIRDSLLGMGANMSVLTKAMDDFYFPQSWICGISWEQYLGWYLWKKGYRTIFDSNAKVLHILQGTSLSRNIRDSRKDLLRWTEYNLTFYRLYGVEPELSILNRLTWLFFDSIINIKKMRDEHDFRKQVNCLKSKFYSEIIGLNWVLHMKIGKTFTPQSDLKKMQQNNGNL